MLRRFFPALLHGLAVASLLQTPTPAVASTISIDIGEGTIMIKGGTAGVAYKAFAHPPDSVKSTPDGARSGTLNASGDSGTLNTAGLTGTYEFVIGGENFLGIPVGLKESKTITVQSLQESNQASLNLFDGGSPVFADASSSVFTAGGQLVVQFNIPNSDTLFGYEITSLNVYRNLNLSYFSQGSFDSSAAIATGQFVEDEAAATGGISIPIAGGSDLAFISVPVDSSSFGTYDLLTGSAAPILPSGGLGPSFEFNIASEPVPEPATGFLLSLPCLIVLANWKRFRRG